MSDSPKRLAGGVPKDAETLRAVSLWILQSLRRGRTRRLVVTELLEQGMEEEAANELVTLVARLASAGYRKLFIIGILWLGVATGLLVLELLFSKSVWLYLLAGFAAALGLLDCFRGWLGWRKYGKMYLFGGQDKWPSQP
jgi:hypothetical protein